MDIKIFVSHRIDKNCETIPDEIFVPIRCGAQFDCRKDVLIQGDNTGDNISYKHPYLSELTVQYWSWKNQKADYYGLCHYRRYWNFSNIKYQTDEYGNIIENYISTNTQKKYALNKKDMCNIIEKYDIVTAMPINIRRLPGNYKTVYEQYYKSTSYLKERDIQLLENAIAKYAPHYVLAAKKYLNGPKAYFCNLYIMKKQIFFDYCNWLFPLLEKLEKEIDTTNYCEEGLRTLGHLAERLYGIYLTYLKDNNCKLKICELQTVVFLHPEKQFPVKPIKPNSVPIVFAANNNFIGPLSVALQSVLKHIDKNRFYDIVILESDIAIQNKKLIKNQIGKYLNVSLRFYNALPLLDGYKLIPHEHITQETFFRFLIQEIMSEYDKVLYLDGDLIVKTDVAKLFDVDITNYMIAAVSDIDFVGQINGAASGMMEYALLELKLENPFKYFQAGVLLFNLKEMRRQHTLQEWLELASIDYKYSDQDVLNVHCQNKVKYLDYRWNVLFDCDDFRIENVAKYAPASMYKKYLESRKEPYIIHYAGGTKPWNLLPTDMFYDFWEIARGTPFYEILLWDIINKKSWETANYHWFECHLPFWKRILKKY